MGSEMCIRDSSEDKALIDDYDAKIEEYYRARSGGGHGTPWTAQIAGLLSNKSRPHMKDFLAKQGFNFR